MESKAITASACVDLNTAAMDGLLAGRLACGTVHRATEPFD